MSQAKSLAKEIAQRTGVDENTALKTLQALGMDERFEAVLAQAKKDVRLDDIRLGFKLAHATVAV